MSTVAAPYWHNNASTGMLVTGDWWIFPRPTAAAAAGREGILIKFQLQQIVHHISSAHTHPDANKDTDNV